MGRSGVLGGISATALASLAVACNPAAFDEVQRAASTRIFEAPDGFTDAHFAETMASFVATVDGVPVSRLAVSSGPGGAIAGYAGWNGTTFPNGAFLYDTCNHSGDCDVDNGVALAGIPSWRTGTPAEGRACILSTAPASGGFTVYCETLATREPVTGSRPGLDLGATAVSLGVARQVGVALLGAPGDLSGAGAIYRVPDGGAAVRIDFEPGTAPPSGALGSTIAAYPLAADRALVAASAPLAGRVVVATLFSDGTAIVNACLDDPTPGFGGALAIGDVDGDHSPDILVGNGMDAGRTDEYPGLRLVGHARGAQLRTVGRITRRGRVSRRSGRRGLRGLRVRIDAGRRRRRRERDRRRDRGRAAGRCRWPTRGRRRVRASGSGRRTFDDGCGAPFPLGSAGR